MGVVLQFPRRHDPLLTKRQLAQMKGVSTKTIDRRVKDGLPSLMVDGQRMFRMSEATDWFGEDDVLRREA